MVINHLLNGMILQVCHPPRFHAGHPAAWQSLDASPSLAFQRARRWRNALAEVVVACGGVGIDSGLVVWLELKRGWVSKMPIFLEEGIASNTFFLKP